MSITRCLGALAVFLVMNTSMAQTPTTTGDAARPADNSKANSAAVNSTIKPTTADGQSNATADIELTRKIRKSVMADKNLSTYAHNIKIVTVNGAVTLNGVVRSEHEKSTIEAKAQTVAGKNNVTNDLTIAP